MAVHTEAKASQLRSSFLRLDAEFFKPEYVEAEAHTAAIPLYGRLGPLCERITQGSNPAFSQSGLACVNGKNVYFGTMEEGDPNYVSPAEFKRLASYRLRRNDIVITLKHATKVGRAWIVEDRQPRIFSRNVGLIRLRSDSPIRHSVLLLYLWTNYGQLLIERAATGGTTGQITLPMSELKRLPVPLIAEIEQQRIDDIFWQSRSAARESSGKYLIAKKLINEALKLDCFEFHKVTGYTTYFSEVESSLRFDAQHHQPRFMRLIDHLAAFFPQRVRDIRTINRRGLQPVYIEGGPIDIVNSQHLGVTQIDYDKLEKTGREAFAAAKEAHVRKDDLLIYTTGAYVGRTNVYLREAPAMASNHVNILRLKPGIDAAYMALVFQSVVGQFQTLKYARGSAQAELYPSDIDRFLVPILGSQTQQEIGNLVRQSVAKQQESKWLLEEAKARVEQLVQEAAQS